MSAATVSPSSPSRPLLMIPGPTEYDSRVLQKLGEPSLSHVSPVFISEFGECIELFRKVLLTAHAQPVILSGSGTLGWDMIVANILEKGERVLVVNTGYFSDSFVACAEAYDIHVDQLKADIGHTILAQTLSEELKHAAAAGKHYSMVFLTHVDTSTGVLNDIHALAKAVKSSSPSTLIAVDGVCSFGSEEFRFDDWGIDAAMTCSQKGLGFPPGLSLIAFSPAAILKYQSRKSKVPAYFIDLKNWLPIMHAYEKRTPSYFATPKVNLIRAARVALKLLLEEAGGMEKVFQIHQQTAHRFRRALHALHLNLLPTDAKHAANTLSAIWYPEDIDKSKLLGSLLKNGVVAAGGLHKDCKANYFRIGHMGVSVVQNNAEMIKKTLEALESSLIEVGHKCEKGAALKAFDHA